MVPVVGSVVGRSAVLVGTAVATSRTRVSTSSSGSNVEFLTFGNSELRSQTAGVTLLPRGAEPTKSQVTKDTSASGSAAGVCSSPATASDKKLLRIERRDVGGEIGHA